MRLAGSSPSTSSPAPTRRPWRRRAARLTLALALGAICGLLAAMPGARLLHRMGMDILLPVRHAVLGPMFPAEESDVAVVVLDEETYHTPPFAQRPQVSWTRELARVIEAVDAAGSTVIGLDIVYPTTLDQPDLLPGFDRPLLKAFHKVGRGGGLVLGQVRLSRQEIAPHRRQVLAAGGVTNVRMLNFLMDADDVVRRYPVWFADEEGGRSLSFGAELARRAGAAVPEGPEFLINYNTGANDIPTFGFADLYHCLESGREGFLRRHFQGKVVLIGTALDVEDRWRTAKRLTGTRPDRTRQPRCVGSFDADRFGEIVDRHTLPGVYVHAAAINTLTKNRHTAPMPAAANGLTVGAATTALTLILFRLSPLAGVLAVLAALALILGAGLALFAGGILGPVTALALAAVAAYTVVYAYRFVAEDRSKRWIQHAFKHFLAPALVERLADDPDALALGGERREVTVFFSDIAGFTTVSEALADRPERLVEIMNRYLTTMTRAVEAAGGYIDKFIGDAVMAVWGAPLPDANAAVNAVRAALACQEALAVFNRDVIEKEYRLPAIGTRIGINTGPAIVGNMGSESRLNYTVTGDTVNLAARLEGANKHYGSRIMIGENTARQCRGAFLLRRLDRLVVKGKRQAVRVYEVVAAAEAATDAQRRRVREFHAAVALYLRRRFDEAEAAFDRLAVDDPVAAIYKDRCAHLREHPPAPGWDGTFALATK